MAHKSHYRKNKNSAYSATCIPCKRRRGNAVSRAKGKGALQNTTKCIAVSKAEVQARASANTLIHDTR